MNKIRVGDCLHHHSTDTWFSVEQILMDGALKVSWAEGDAKQTNKLAV